MDTFLYWVGKKSRLLKFIKASLPANINNYYEPFLGSGAVYFDLVSEGLIKANKSHLSDTQVYIIMTMQAVKKRLNEVVPLLKHHERNHSKTYFNELKQEVFYTSPEIAAQFIYLSRAGFSGIYRENSNGLYNVTMRPNEAPRWVEDWLFYACEGFLKETKIKCCDFKVALQNEYQENDFVYCDPPYQSWVEKNERSVYNHKLFSTKDQVDLCWKLRKLDKLGVKWMLSNSNSDIIKTMYEPFNIKYVPITYKVTQQNLEGIRTKELIITNY